MNSRNARITLRIKDNKELTNSLTKSSMKEIPTYVSKSSCKTVRLPTRHNTSRNNTITHLHKVNELSNICTGTKAGNENLLSIY